MDKRQFANLVKKAYDLVPGGEVPLVESVYSSFEKGISYYKVELLRTKGHVVKAVTYPKSEKPNLRVEVDEIGNTFRLWGWSQEELDNMSKALQRASLLKEMVEGKEG